MSNSTTKISLYVSDSEPSALSDMTRIPTGTSFSISDARSTTVTEYIGAEFAAGSVHARTVSFSLTMQPGSSESVSGILKDAYEGKTLIYVGIKGSVNHDGLWTAYVSDFPASIASASNEEITVTLIHDGQEPAEMPS